MKSKHILAIVAFILILATTACSINPDDPNFDAYFPMEINGSKSMSGNIEVAKPTKDGYFYSSNITPPR